MGKLFSEAEEELDETMKSYLHVLLGIAKKEGSPFIKYSPKGGTITLGYEMLDNQVRNLSRMRGWVSAKRINSAYSSGFTVSKIKGSPVLASVFIWCQRYCGIMVHVLKLSVRRAAFEISFSDGMRRFDIYKITVSPIRLLQ
ncbi:hypothetical protein IDJ77_02295 [Mucilaginibacter sp. ZT4R22]|uniref:Uncharacterized protein n=1 Tax=Mucilaginibacter pankratovii TaxID=2772110 RepID=A0ABR7WKK0_9SPHI|nr:hypothetical protein [Mucilaginibacter pankratovii]